MEVFVHSITEEVAACRLVPGALVHQEDASPRWHYESVTLNYAKEGSARRDVGVPSEDPYTTLHFTDEPFTESELQVPQDTQPLSIADHSDRFQQTLPSWILGMQRVTDILLGVKMGCWTKYRTRSSLVWSYGTPRSVRDIG